MSSSSPSMDRSEGVFSSALFSGAQSSFSSASNGRQIRGPSPHDDRMLGAQTPRSVDFTEAPQLGREENDLHSSSTHINPSGHHSRHSVDGGNGDVHRYAMSESSNDSNRIEMDTHMSYNEGHHKVEQDAVHGTIQGNASSILPPRSGACVDETATFNIYSTDLNPAPATPMVAGGSGGFSTPSSSSSSSTANSSLSAPRSARRGADSDVPSSVAQSLASAVLSSNDPLVALSPEQMEAALQLYVERGGVHPREVAAMLQELPWCTTLTTHASPITVAAGPVEEDADEEAEQQLLEPEAWLGAVAAATVSAVATAENGERASAAAPSAAMPITSAGVPHETQRQHSTAEEASPIVMQLSNLSDESTPGPVERTARKRRSLTSFSSEFGAAGRASVDRGASCGRRRDTVAVSEMGSRPCPRGDDDSEGDTRRINNANNQHVSADCRLAYDDVGGDCAGRSADVGSSSSFPQIAPRDWSASVQYRQQQQQQQQQQLLPGLASDDRTSRSSPFHYSGSATPHSADDRRLPHATASTSPLTSSPVVVTAGATEAADPPTASMLTAAPTEAGGMRTLFQLCLQTPLAAASATLRVSDWHTLLDKLRQEGHHKLPPQPILDDVARTITHIMQSEGHPDGLTLSSFACIMQRQLKEVRGDMTSPLSADFATGDGTASRQGAVLHFPQHPKYVLAVPTSAVAAAPQSSLPPLKRRGRRSSQTTLTVASNSGLWRVLPTWCMALAGLFPLEMSSVCPVPVVCYLRSIGLIRAVLEAIMQRLQLELEAIPEYVASFAKAARRETQHHSESAAAESFVQSLPPEGSEGSRSVSNLLTLSGASAGARRACSAVVARGAVSASSDGDGRWKEQPVWCSAMSGRHRRRVKYRKRDAATNTTTIPGGTGSDGAVVVSYPQRVTNGNRRLNTDVTISASSDDVKSHYLDQRPLDEISVSVVARAKARRLMDTLRRHTVPINRYECFARVEPESEPVQKPLCFVSQEELKSTFGGGDEDSHDDSDAMSDMMAALTYNPGEETVVGLGGTATKGGGDVDVDQSRSSPHPPPLSRIPASSVLPTVIMSATRFSASRAASVGSSVILSATSAGAGGAIRPPPRVPSMFRMSGVLPTALPRKQEEALVRRLSKPTCNPAAMSLRAASTENAYTHCHAADTTAIISTSDSASVNAKETEDRSTRLAPSRPPSGAAAQHHYRSHPHLLDHKLSNKTVLRNDRAPLSRNVCHRPRSCSSSAWANPYCTSVGANHQHRPSSSVVSDMGGGGGCLLQLTEEQSRDFTFFDVPSVLVAAPLSSSAAAVAAVQVMGGGAPVAPLLDAGAPLQPLDPHRRADHSAASRGATRGASRTGAAPPARANAKCESTEGRQAGSTSRNAVAKPVRRGSRFRKSSSRCLSDAPQRGQAAADPHGMGCISSRTIIDSGASAHPPLSPHPEPHISLYERRLYRQLQLAHADEPVYHHTNGRKGKGER